MRDEKRAAANGGIGFVGLLAILFIALKLLDRITWPWVWVLSPLWVPVAVVLAVALAAIVVGVVSGAVQRRRERPKARLGPVRRGWIWLRWKHWAGRFAKSEAARRVDERREDRR